MAITNESVRDYLSMMHGTSLFDELEEAEKEKIIFTATELLKDYYGEEKLNDRAVALQVIYILEGDSEEFEMLKRHGVKSYSVKGVSVTFEGDMISPLVIRLIEGDSKAMTGRLI